MCKFLSSTFREGVVISAIGPEDNEGHRVAKNSHAMARKIGKLIAAREASYLDALARSFETCCDATVALGETNTLMARFEPGLIIDFPLIQYSAGGFDLSARSCLTVCAGEAQSKVWTRIGQKISPDLRDYSSEEIARLNTISRNCAEAANASLAKIYETDFRHARGEEIHFDEYGRISISAVDCVGSEISSQIREALLDLSWNAGVKSMKPGEISNTLRDVTSYTMPSIGRDSSSTGEFRLDDRADFVPFESTRGAQALFVAASDDKHAYLSGIVDAGEDVSSPKFDEAASLPLSLGATAELASQIGSAY